MLYKTRFSVESVLIYKQFVKSSCRLVYFAEKRVLYGKLGQFKKIVKSLQVICTRDSTKVLRASLCLSKIKIMMSEKKNDTCKFASFNHHSFFADMWWIAVCITKSDSRDPTATRKYFRIQRISQVYWSDVMREIFDQKAGFNSEAKLFGIGVGFTSG